MTNQEAMRGKHKGITRELIDAVGVLPDLASKREMKIWSYFLQEVASRDARIAKLEAALKEITEQCYTHHCIYIAWEALKEQP